MCFVQALCDLVNWVYQCDYLLFIYLDFVSYMNYLTMYWLFACKYWKVSKLMPFAILPERASRKVPRITKGEKIIFYSGLFLILASQVITIVSGIENHKQCVETNDMTNCSLWFGQHSFKSWTTIMQLIL